jgi:hypothetical protein
MISNTIAGISIILLAVSGFISLATLMWTLWERTPRKTGGNEWNFFKRGSHDHSLAHSDCYDECMTERHWEPTEVRQCVSACGM